MEEMDTSWILERLESKHNAVSAAEEHARANSPTPAAPVPALPCIPPSSFIAAADGDFDEAERRWRATVAWRREHRISDLLRRPDRAAFAAIRAHLPHTLGRDASGRVVMHVQLGRLALDKLRTRLRGDAREALLCHACAVLEWVRESAGVSVGEGGASMSAVLDLSALGSMDRSSVRSALELSRALLDVLQTHYPESLHMLFVVLGRSRIAERLFDVVWRAARRCLDPATAAKVRVVRGAKPAATVQLARFGLARNALPVFLGGTRLDSAAGSADDVAFAACVLGGDGVDTGECGSNGGSESACAAAGAPSAAAAAARGCTVRAAQRTSLGSTVASDGTAAAVPALPHRPATLIPGALSPLELARLADEWESAAAPVSCATSWTEEWEALLVAIDEVRAAVVWGGAQLKLEPFTWTPAQWTRRRTAARAT